MAINIEVEVDMADAMKRLAGMEARAKNFTPVFIEARGDLEKANAANFAANGLPTGKAWAPLDPQYGSWKSANFPGRGTLVRTGRLFRSLTNMKGTPSYIAPERAEFGTSVEYAKFHQYGTPKMAKRKVIFEPPLFAKQTAKNAGEYVANGVF